MFTGRKSTSQIYNSTGDSQNKKGLLVEWRQHRIKGVISWPRNRVYTRIQEILWKALFQLYDPLTTQVPILRFRGNVWILTLSTLRVCSWFNKVTPRPVPRTTLLLLHVAMSTSLYRKIHVCVYVWGWMCVYMHGCIYWSGNFTPKKKMNVLRINTCISQTIIHPLALPSLLLPSARSLLRPVLSPRRQT